MNKGTAIVGFLLCFIAGMGLMWGVDRNGSPRPAGGAEIAAEGASSDGGGVWSDEDSPVPVSSKDPVWGNRAAPVTLVLFSDFQCPFCTQGRGDHQPGGRRSTVRTSSASSGRATRCPSTRTPAPRPSRRRPCSASAAPRRSGSSTTRRSPASASLDAGQLRALGRGRRGRPREVQEPRFGSGCRREDRRRHGRGKEGRRDRDAEQLHQRVLDDGRAAAGEGQVSIDDTELASAQRAIAAGTPADRVYAKLSQENKARNPPPKEASEPAEDDKTVYEGAGREIAGPRPRQAAGDDRGVQRLPVPLLQARRARRSSRSGRRTADKVRIVWKNNPLDFHPRAARRRARHGSAGAEGRQGLLGRARSALQEPAEARRRVTSSATRRSSASTWTRSRSRDQGPRSTKPRSPRIRTSPTTSRPGHAPLLHQRPQARGRAAVDKFKAVIDEELKKAEALLAKGVKPKDLYDEIIKDGKEPPPPRRRPSRPPAADSPFKGARDAKVVIQEIYSDFQCPFCKRVEDTVKQVEKTYGEKIKIVWRHKPLPMHKDAPLASEASQELFKQKGSDGFWKYHGRSSRSRAAPTRSSAPRSRSYAEQRAASTWASSRRPSTSNTTRPSSTPRAPRATRPASAARRPSSSAPSEKGQLTATSSAARSRFRKFKKAIDKALAEGRREVSHAG
jgi:protein-disulfide isomerase